MSSSSAGFRIYYLVPTYRCPAMNRLYASRPDVQQLNSPSLQPTSTFGPLGRALWSCVASAPHRSSSVNAWILLWMKDRWGLTDRAGAEVRIASFFIHSCILNRGRPVSNPFRFDRKDCLWVRLERSGLFSRHHSPKNRPTSTFSPLRWVSISSPVPSPFRLGFSCGPWASPRRRPALDSRL